MAHSSRLCRKYFLGNQFEVLRSKPEDHRGVSMIRQIITLQLDINNVGRSAEEDLARALASDAAGKGLEYPKELLRSYEEMAASDLPGLLAAKMEDKGDGGGDVPTPQAGGASSGSTYGSGGNVGPHPLGQQGFMEPAVGNP